MNESSVRVNRRLVLLNVLIINGFRGSIAIGSVTRNDHEYAVCGASPCRHPLLALQFVLVGLEEPSGHDLARWPQAIGSSNKQSVHGSRFRRLDPFRHFANSTPPLLKGSS